MKDPRLVPLVVGGKVVAVGPWGVIEDLAGRLRRRGRALIERIEDNGEGFTPRERRAVAQAVQLAQARMAEVCDRCGRRHASVPAEVSDFGLTLCARCRRSETSWRTP